MSNQQWFKWTVEFQVHKTWVEDGFELTDDRAHDMLSNDLGFAYGHELKAKVTSAPDPEAIAKAQGYKSLSDRIGRDLQHAERLKKLA